MVDAVPSALRDTIRIEAEDDDEDEKMRLMVNGDWHEHKGDGSVKALLLEVDADCDRVAIMVNDEVVTREQRDSVVLKENDRVEVLTFAGGG